MGKTAQERGLSYVPKCYKVQPLDRPKMDPKIANVPLIDLAGMSDPTRRSILIHEIANACRRYGFFQCLLVLAAVEYYSLFHYHHVFPFLSPTQLLFLWECTVLELLTFQLSDYWNLAAYQLICILQDLSPSIVPMLVINHGISKGIVDGALSTASDFFNLPTQYKANFMSNDVHKPVRYGSSLKDGVDKVQFWRVFLKHYAHPLKDWIGLWPHTPLDYRNKMGEYVEAAQQLAQMIMGLITESLGLGPTYLSSKLDEGMQVMTVNCYPPCPQPQLALGLPAHSDYSSLTIVLQDSPGLQILDTEDNSWKMVPAIPGALQVHVGDQLEVLSNGKYKSVVHRVTLNSEKTRISIAGLHSLGMDVKMEAAKEMVDEENRNGYRESCFRDFLDFISKNDIGEGSSFLNTIKIQK
ncbi:hypothetical protein DH2020_048364 [Rehmannia glutinosa]|uniref:Fe2OG dioxygenase domain-containing protein n=1 Tax=Rehmannia glutinosa TaxID=99300 RepID=A0ABR0U6S9_REHGL